MHLGADARPESLDCYSSAGCAGNLAPHKAFEFAGGPVDRLVHRLSRLSVLGDHLGHRRLRENLVAGADRRRGDAYRWLRFTQRATEPCRLDCLMTVGPPNF